MYCNINVCSKCGKPIIGFFTRFAEKNFCMDCMVTTTIYDLVSDGDLPMLPDIVETDSPVTGTMEKKKKMGPMPGVIGREQEQVRADIEALSEEDFMSKYCDDSLALSMWYDAQNPTA